MDEMVLEVLEVLEDQEVLVDMVLDQVDDADQVHNSSETSLHEF
jgi:hypothetical protein